MSVVYPGVDVGSLTGTGAAFRLPVRVSTAAAGTLASSFAAGQTVNGVVLALSNRILIKNQAAATENGIYVVTAGTPTRAEDYAAGQSGGGVYVYATAGTTAPNSTWVCTSAAGSDIIGTNNLTFVQMGDVVTTAAQTLTNKTMSTGSTWSGNTIGVANGGTGATTLTSGNVLVGAGTGAVTTTKAAPAGVFVGTTDAQTLTNKTLTAPIIATISNTGTLTLPTSTDTLVGRATTDTLTNKTLTAPVIATIVNTGTLTLPTSTDTLVGRATTDTLTNKTLTAPIIATISNTGTLTLPTSTDTLVGRATTDTLTNKTLTAGSTIIADGADATKRFAFVASGATTGAVLTLSSTQAASATISFPNVTTSDTLIGAATAATLTNKTLTAPVIATIVNSGTLTLPTSTDTLVGRATTDTLTNKTLAGATNTIEASALRTATTAVVISAATAPTTGQVLTATSGTAATWQTPAGGGGVTGPGTSTDRAIATYNGTAGNALRNTGVTIDASNNIAGAGNIRLAGALLDANGATLIAQTATASAVNYLRVTNAATGGFPMITADGTDLAIPLAFASNADEAGSNVLNFYFMNATIPTRRVTIQLEAANASAEHILQFSSTNSQTYGFPDSTGLVVLDSNVMTITNKALDTTNIFIDESVGTKQLAFNLAGMTASRTLTIAATQTTTQSLTIPNVGAADSFVTNNTTATLTNKTITGSTNTIEATALRSATTAVVVNGATAPTAGQVLTATSGTAANWQSPSSVFGTQLSTVTLASASTNSTTLITVPGAGLPLSTGAVPAGTYLVEWTCNVSVNATNNTMTLSHRTSLGILPPAQNGETQTYRVPLSGLKFGSARRAIIVLGSADTINVDLFISLSNGSGTFTLTNLVITVYRIA